MDQQATEAPPPSPGRVTKPRGRELVAGYDCEFVSPPPDPLPYLCSICCHVLNNPHQVDCCGNHFCRPCIEEVKQRGQECPLCREVDFVASPDRHVQRNLGASLVYCTHRKLGCGWTGRLEDLEGHLNATPAAGDELTGCEYQQLPCVHECGIHVARRTLVEHRTCCTNRPFTCEYCQFQSTYSDVTTIHVKVCPCYPVQCPNGCGVSPLQRQNLNAHLMTECRLQVVTCEFQFAGCIAEVPRKDMAQHLKEGVHQHLSQVSRCTSTLFNDVQQRAQEKAAEMDEKVEEVKKQAWHTVSEVLLLSDTIEQSTENCKFSSSTVRRMVHRKIQKAQHQILVLTLLVVVAALTLLLGLSVSTSYRCTQGITELRLRVAELDKLVSQNQAKMFAMSKNISECAQQPHEKPPLMQEQKDQTCAEPPERGNTAHVSIGDEHLDNQHTPINLTETVRAILSKQEEHDAMLHWVNGVINDPPLNASRTLVFGPCLTTGKTGIPTFCIVVPANIFGALCVSSQLPYYCTDFSVSDVTATLTCRSQAYPSVVNANVTYADMEGFSAVTNITYTPEVRGISQLSIRIKDIAVPNSPFQVFVKHDLKKLGTPVLTISKVLYPWDIAINKHGELFVTEHTLNRFSVIDSRSGSVQQHIALPEDVQYPSGIAVDSNDRVYVATAGSIHKYSRGGKLLRSKRLRCLTEAGNHLAVHKDEIYILCGQSVLVCDSFLSVKSPYKQFQSTISNPRDLAFDSTGNRSFMTDKENGKLEMYDEMTKESQTLISPRRLSVLRGKNKPEGIAVFGEHVYVSDTETNQVTVFTTDGKDVHVFGSAGKGPGEFDRPMGITVDTNGFVYVCDYNNDRVQVF